jgi:hypothetical protein
MVSSFQQWNLAKEWHHSSLQLIYVGYANQYGVFGTAFTRDADGEIQTAGALQLTLAREPKQELGDARFKLWTTEINVTGKWKNGVSWRKQLIAFLGIWRRQTAASEAHRNDI